MGDWSLDTCSSQRASAHGDLKVKVLTYNLFWWNLFGQRGGNGGSAGKLIKDAGSAAPFDLMGFRECDDVNRVLGDAGLTDTFGTVSPGHAVAIAYRNTVWELLDSGMDTVGEDKPGLYGSRVAVWARLRHQTTGITVFFINHHGPLPVNSGGVGGGKQTAQNILNAIRSHADPEDMQILTGDFNADAHSATLKELSEHMNHDYVGTSFGGVDNFLSNCASSAEATNLGNGGSDHDALSIVFTPGSN